MAAPKKTLDESRSYAMISSMDPDPNRAVYEQDGRLFDRNKKECGKTDGFKRLQEVDKRAEEKQASADAIEAAARAADILGGLDAGPDLDADARRENASAAAAESMAD